MSALIVILRPYRKAFDIKNAFNWANQKIKLALDYPYGMPQYAVINGVRERLSMALQRTLMVSQMDRDSSRKSAMALGLRS